MSSATQTWIRLFSYPSVPPHVKPCLPALAEGDWVAEIAGPALGDASELLSGVIREIAGGNGFHLIPIKIGEGLFVLVGGGSPYLP